MVRRGRRLAGIAMAIALIATACVYPLPGPSDSVPTISITATESAATQTVTFSATTTHLNPTWIRVWPEGLAGPYETVAGAPWSVEIDTAGYVPGVYNANVIAFDGTTYVGGTIEYEVIGCNGSMALCTRSYASVAYATTHNAMSSANDGWIGPNHTLDVPEQLDLGVRALMLDTYRAGDLNGIGQPQVPNVDPDDSYLCHTFCSLGKQPLVDGLAEIAAFLAANPGEVVTLIIESYLSHELTADAFVASGLDAYTYAHTDGTPWPTLGALIDADTRLVVLQDRSLDPAYPHLMNVWQYAFETPFSNAVPGDFTCDDLRGTPPDDLFILNHFLTDVFGSPELAEQVNVNPLLADRVAECTAFYDRIPNFIAADFVSIGDTLAVVDQLNGVG